MIARFLERRNSGPRENTLCSFHTRMASRGSAALEVARFEERENALDNSDATGLPGGASRSSLHGGSAIRSSGLPGSQATA